MADGTCTENRGRMDGAAFSGRSSAASPRVRGILPPSADGREPRGGRGRQVRCAAPLPASRFRGTPPPEGRAFRAAGGLPRSPVWGRRLRQREQGGEKKSRPPGPCGRRTPAGLRPGARTGRGGGAAPEGRKKAGRRNFRLPAAWNGHSEGSGRRLLLGIGFLTALSRSSSISGNLRGSDGHGNGGNGLGRGAQIGSTL